MAFLRELFAVSGFFPLFFSPAAMSAGPAAVEAVKSPAWLDRGGRKMPPAAGMDLQSGDVVRTGSGARAYLMFAEGSRVKLGDAALDILLGAFRFTTAKLKKALPRCVATRVGTAIIDFRGTDLWGKTDKDGDRVALIEGRIEITRAGQNTELAQPMTYFDVPNGRAAEVKPFEMETLVKLARQTEMLPGDGAARARGRWRVLAGTAASEEAALELYDPIPETDFSARIRLRTA